MVVGVERSKVREVLVLEWWRRTRRWVGVEVLELRPGALKFSRRGTVRSDEPPLRRIVGKGRWTGCGDSNLFGIRLSTSTSWSEDPTAVISGYCSGK